MVKKFCSASGRQTPNPTAGSIPTESQTSQRQVRMEIKKAEELREAVKSALSVGSMASSMLKSTSDVEIGVNSRRVDESMC